MGIFSRKVAEQKPKISTYNEIIYGATPRNIIRSEDNLPALAQLYKNNAIIYSLVDWKASRMSEIKPELFKVIDKGASKEFKRWNGKYSESYEIKKLKQLRAKAYEEIDLDNISNHNLRYGKIKRILSQPNNSMTWKKFVYHYSSSKDISGFQPIWGNRLTEGINQGLFEELIPLPAHLTEIISGGMMQPIESYRVMLHEWTKTFNPEDVLLISNHSFDYNINGSQLYGTSRVRAALQEIDTYKYAKDRELYSYQTGDAQTLLMPKDGAVAEWMAHADNQPLVQNWLDSIFKRLRQKTRDGIVVSPHSLEAQRIGTSLNESNTTESKADAISRMCGVWHINPIIIGQNATNTDAKIKEVTKMALRDAVFPDARELNEGLNSFWMETYKERLNENLEIVFDYEVFSEFSQDIKETADALSKIDVLSDNEKRTDWLNYDPLDDERADMPQKYWDMTFDPINYEDSETAV